MSIKEPIVYSNFLFFANAVIYGYLGFEILMILFFFTAVFSFQYHRFPKSTVWHSLDRFFATISLVTVLLMSWMHLSLLNFCLILCLAFATLCIKRYGDIQTDKIYYSKCHTIWHCSVFLGNFISAVVLYKL